MLVFVWSTLLCDLSAVRYLQEKEFLCDLLDEFLRNIFREELCSELKLQRILLLHILLRHLERTRTQHFISYPSHVFTVCSLGEIKLSLHLK